MSSRIIFILFSALIGIQNITRAEVPIFDAQMTKLRIAQESELSRDSYYFRFDNDMLALPSTDENYTMGIAMSWNTHRPLSLSSIDNDPLFIPLNLIRSLWLVPGTSGKEKENKPSDRSIILQDDAFTPFCLHSAPVCAAQGHPINQDRPYSNIIWTGVTYNYFNDELNEGRRTELDIGILGTSIGKDVQTAIHERCCRDKIPQEWGTQIGDGGSPTFLIKQINTVGLPQSSGELKIDFNYGFWAGWYVWPTAGLRATFFRAITTEFDMSYVLYNEQLQGAWSGRNTISYPYSQIEKWIRVGHLNIDIPALWDAMFEKSHQHRCWTFQYGQHWKSRDLKVSGVEQQHRWGSLSFEFEY